MLPIFCDKKKFNFDAYRIITVIFNAKYIGYFQMNNIIIIIIAPIIESNSY